MKKKIIIEGILEIKMVIVSKSIVYEILFLVVVWIEIFF